MTKFKWYLIVGAVCLSFGLGGATSISLLNNNTISINGKRVEVVDVMYKYQNEEGKEVHGDYSIVSQNGYEYTEDGTYTKDYQDAVVRK